MSSKAVSVRGTENLCAFGPGGEIFLLLGRELVDLHVEGLELEARDLAVYFLGYGIDLLLEFAGVFDEVLDGERLIREAHVHDDSGMAFGGGKVDEAAFAEEINFAAIAQRVLLDIRP